MDVSIFTVLFLLIGCRQSAATSIYNSLHEYVKSQIDGPYLPPVYDHTESLHLNLQMAVVDVADVDRLNNQVEISLIMAMNWNSSITWNPQQYDNVRFLPMDPNEIWHPRISFLNAVTAVRDDPNAQIQLGFFGSASLTGFYKFRVICDLSEGNKCKVAMMTSAYGNHVISVEDPASSRFDLKPHFELFQQNQAQYSVVESHVNKSAFYIPFTGGKDRLDLHFTFKDVHQHEHTNWWH